MEKMLPGRHWVLAPLRLVPALGAAVLFAVVLSGTAPAQQTPVTGTVTSQAGNPLRGVTVRLQGSEIRTLTDANGRYSIAAPPTGVLNFTIIGQRLVQTNINGRTRIDVSMEPIAFLEEVVVTAYTEQRRANITGAIASMNVEAASRQTTASVLQKLDVTVPGITVAASGSPGARSTVRIRGISSFQNNDPLYIVDGTPVQDSYINFLNPNDITSVQVLKDASSASIYGARASNGVIVITTTKRGISGPPKTTFSVRTGIASPVRGYDDFLIMDALQYHQILKQSYENAGLPVPTNIYGDPNNPTIPQYIYAEDALVTSRDSYGRPTAINTAGYSFPRTLAMPGSSGTNWWKAVFSPAQVSDYNLDIAGGSEQSVYGVSFNYFSQQGTAAYNMFRRGSVRVNTAFTQGRLRFGENVALSQDRHTGGIPDDPGGYAEDGILGKNILMQPVVPVYDVAGNFASGKSVGLGNQSNPLKFAWGAKDNVSQNTRIFGNIFAGLEANPALSLKTRLGFNLGQGSFAGYSPIVPENSEPTFTNSINENQNQFVDWTWSNTAEYERTLRQHNLKLLLGQEANATTTRALAGSMASLISTDINSRYLQDALGNPSTKNVTSSGSKSALLSFFGKADYTFAERYTLSFTLRQDGSSRLGPTHRWGTFPAVGAGWRLSNESFFPQNGLFSDVMLRFGWGVTGNQQIPAGRIVSQFGGDRGDTYYDIGGTNNTVTAGFRQTSLGNPDLKWEENRSTNLGADVVMLDGRVSAVIDLYKRNTANLLFDPPTPATAGVAAPPVVNVGKMSNDGFDFSLGYKVPSFSVTLSGSRYKNKIVSIDGVQDFFYGPISTRFGNQVINKVGYPIGSFYGLIADGLFRDAADGVAHKLVSGACPTAPCQDGAAMGRIRFRDVNGDGQITLADRTIIGNPHPAFSAGLDIGVRRGNWDLSTTFFGTFGNDIFDVQKEFYVFRNFSTNVRKDLLTDSWTPQNPGAKYPRLDVNDNFSRAISSYYVEDGSYVRLRSMQIGYNVPPKFARWTAASRIYVQAENLFTITGYDGLDPALPAANVFGPAGDIRDQYRGVDRGSYPSNRILSIGLTTSF